MHKLHMVIDSILARYDCDYAQVYIMEINKEGHPPMFLSPIPKLLGYYPGSSILSF